MLSKFFTLILTNALSPKGEFLRCINDGFTKAKERLGDVSFAGGRARVAIDDGMAVTKICASIGDYRWWYKTDTLCTKDNVNVLIEECMSEKGIKLMKTDIKYTLSSEFTKGIFGTLIK